MKNEKWQLNRAGVLNFWYYDDEEFNFSDGKLLLRGSNGSGKSVTMQSLIPVLLDGRKSAERLDPFGSRARKMEDYLLGEKGVVDRDERTGYLYFEYKREKTNQYVTTGIGLRAKRHSNMNFWGFVILDNRRIGHDLFLYKTEYSAEEGKEQKIPLTRKELERRLETGGRVVKGQREYMELVNRYVFGFESLESYEELIKLLIQLRSPKLSKDFKPTVIYEILNESLPALSDDELRPLSDTIENMDQTKQQLDQLLRDSRSLSRLCKQYRVYNQFVLAEKADGFLSLDKKLNKLVQQEKELNGQLENNYTELKMLTEQMEELKREQEVLEEEERALKDHDVFKAEKEKGVIEKSIKEQKNKIQHKEQVLEQKKNSERQLKRRIEEEEEKISATEKSIIELLDALDMEIVDTAFDGHPLAREEFKKNYQSEYYFDLWKADAYRYKEKLEFILESMEEHSRVKDRYQALDRELAEANKKLDLAVLDQKNWEVFFEEEKGNYLHSFHQWNKQNLYLRLDSEEIQLTAQRINEIYQPYRLEEVKEPIVKAYKRYYQQLQQDVIGINHSIEAKKQDIELKTTELNQWKSKKDPEPIRHPDTLAARSKLKKAGIPYLPFFAAVEFLQGVPPEQRERLESAITQMGLLDALIVPDKYMEQVREYDRVIKPNANIFAHTLAEFLYPTPVEGIAVTAKDIENVLRSVLVDDAGDGSAFVSEDGSYRVALIKGHAPRESSSIYIGKESRRQYRLQMIEQINTQLKELQRELIVLEDKKEDLIAMAQQLEEEYHAFPADNDVNEAYRNLINVNEQVRVRQEEVEAKNNQVRRAWQELQEIRSKLRQLTEGMPLKASEETYKKAQAAMQSYLKYLQRLELKHKDYANSNTLLIQLKTNLDDVIYDVDELTGELNVLESEIKGYNMRLKQVQQRLQQLGADEIRERIAGVQSRIMELPDEIIKVNTGTVELKSQINNTQNKLGEIKKNIKYTAQLCRLWQQVFADELKLGLVDAAYDDEDIMKSAKMVLQQYRELLRDSDREKVTNRLNNAFFQEQAVLVEYRLTQEVMGEVTAIEVPAESEVLKIQAEQLMQKSRRTHLLMEYQGKRVSPYYVMEQMEKEVELQKIILNDKDRELYEEIIMNSVGRIIRGRINRAQRWVKQISELMEQRDTSSGLTFSIRWKPRTAEHEEELDTKDLVDLLRANPRMLKEEDIRQITQHFRSKIGRAKEALAEKGYGETLHQMFKEILDYRKWFSFTLYYRREGEQRKELTNNVFYTFSGGEKAMAMYIPLFSAAYSRYLDARQDAPYIISLDEAFAGVDENNIRDMFDLVEKLGFNYIMNSQALWGDYDTVSALSICELVRPKNAPYVTVIRYHWDGKMKTLLHGLDIKAPEQTASQAASN
ncbi:TIGR02680 family protein [Desulfofalx alkaliphila]|uniref:TIGR02680 family protein n=1 Tax=Desulfofalx alkaliphila TaxID=105483 RepID=UPI00068C437B|nr:TIGR02680 family protein [Desulfofalx alkaliphila]